MKTFLFLATRFHVVASFDNPCLFCRKSHTDMLWELHNLNKCRFIWYSMVHDVKWYMVWWDKIRFDVTKYDMIWYDIWYDIWYMIWYDMIYDIWCDTIWYDTIRYDMIWYDSTIQYKQYHMIWLYMCVCVCVCVFACVCLKCMGIYWHGYSLHNSRVRFFKI